MNLTGIKNIASALPRRNQKDSRVQPKEASPSLASVPPPLFGSQEKSMDTVNRVYSSKDCGLLSTAFWGESSKVLRLLEEGADINYQSPFYRTALMTAITQGNKEVATLLIEKGANLNLQDDVGETALIKATESDDVEIVQVLIEKGADLNLQDKEGKTALIKAIESENIEIAKALIEKGAHLNLQDKEGKTALIKAIESENIEIIAKDLIKRGAHLNLQDKKGKTALIKAIEKQNTEIATLLINQGADCELQDKNGRTPLHWATRYGNHEVSHLLLEKGVNIHLADVYGNDALKIAANTNNLFTARELLKAGGNVFSTNKAGFNALAMAFLSGGMGLSEYLSMAGSTHALHQFHFLTRFESFIKEEEFLFTVTTTDKRTGSTVKKIIIPAALRLYNIDEAIISQLYGTETLESRQDKTLIASDGRKLKAIEAKVSGTFDAKLGAIFKSLQALFSPGETLSIAFPQPSAPHHTHFMKLSQDPTNPDTLTIQYRDNELAIQDVDILQTLQIDLSNRTYTRTGHIYASISYLLPQTGGRPKLHPFYNMINDLYRCVLLYNPEIPHGNSSKMFGPIFTVEGPGTIVDGKKIPGKRTSMYLNEGLTPQHLEVWKALELAMDRWTERKQDWLNVVYKVLAETSN